MNDSVPPSRSHRKHLLCLHSTYVFLSEVVKDNCLPFLTFSLQWWPLRFLPSSRPLSCSAGLKNDNDNDPGEAACMSPPAPKPQSALVTMSSNPESAGCLLPKLLNYWKKSSHTIEIIPLSLSSAPDEQTSSMLMRFRILISICLSRWS